MSKPSATSNTAAADLIVIPPESDMGQEAGIALMLARAVLTIEAGQQALTRDYLLDSNRLAVSVDCPRFSTEDPVTGPLLTWRTSFCVR
jgi:hypothetical protein